MDVDEKRFDLDANVLHIGCQTLWVPVRVGLWQREKIKCTNKRAIEYNPTSFLAKRFEFSVVSTTPIPPDPVRSEETRKSAVVYDWLRNKKCENRRVDRERESSVRWRRSPIPSQRGRNNKSSQQRKESGVLSLSFSGKLWREKNVTVVMWKPNGGPKVSWQPRQSVETAAGTENKFTCHFCAPNKGCWPYTADCKTFPK